MMYARLIKILQRLMLLAFLSPAGSGMLLAQKYYTKNGSIAFFSKTPIENITASNNQVVSVLNTQNGELQFSLLIRNFHFKKALMEEHFNENYLESDKFPKATFKGVIADAARINFDKDGDYKVTVSGELTVHGITKKNTSIGTISIKGGKIAASSRFIVQPGDFDIRIPKVVSTNIAENIEVTVSCIYDQKM